MTKAQLFVFEDTVCTDEAIEIASKVIVKGLEKHDAIWHEQFKWHETWRNGTIINSNELFEDALKFCRVAKSSGVACFDFQLNYVQVTEEHIEFVFKERVIADDIKAHLRDKPGLLLAWAMAINQDADVIVLLSTSNSEVRATFESVLKQEAINREVGNLNGSVPVLAQRKHLGADLSVWIDNFIKNDGGDEPEPPPEQAIKAFFEWRRTDPTATTAELHNLDNVDLSTFKKHDAYKALRDLLRFAESELDSILKLGGCQRALLEALKGMGGNDKEPVNQQCSILGLFLIAWSAFRVKSTKSNLFEEALRSFSNNWGGCEAECKAIAKKLPVTQGLNSMSAVLSAFFVFLELATEDDRAERTTNQVNRISLDKYGFTIGFKLKSAAFDEFKSTVEKVFSEMHSSFEREGQPVAHDGGSLTSKALIHLVLEVGCRQAIFCGDQRAEMSVQWKKSNGMVVIKFAPRGV